MVLPLFFLKLKIYRLLSHPEVSDDPEEEETPAQALGTASTTESNMDEGEIKDGEQTAQSLICNDCQKLFRDGKKKKKVFMYAYVNFFI